MNTVSLNAEAEIPMLGFGTWQLTGRECRDSVAFALKTGYRHIDTADKYGNHQEVGEGIKESRIPRKDIFLTTKIWRDSLTKDEVAKNAERFLKELQTEYIDLLLIHWPNKDVDIQETLEAMNKLKEQGKIRAIGVSNFGKHHISQALSTGIEVANNQIEIHATFAQEELVRFCQDKGVSATAYSPLGRGEDLELPILKEIAEKHQASPAQVSLAWLFSRNIIAIPKSDKEKEIAENFESQELNLPEEDLAKLNSIPQNQRLVNPEFAEWE